MTRSACFECKKGLVLLRPHKKETGISSRVRMKGLRLHRWRRHPFSFPLSGQSLTAGTGNLPEQALASPHIHCDAGSGLKQGKQAYCAGSAALQPVNLSVRLPAFCLSPSGPLWRQHAEVKGSFPFFSTSCNCYDLPHE